MDPEQSKKMINHRLVIALLDSSEESVRHTAVLID